MDVRIGIRPRRAAALAVAVVLALVATGCDPAAWTKAPIEGFIPVKHYVLDSITQDQGPATVYRTSPTTGKPELSLVYGGEAIPSAFSSTGWNHVGDPDSLDGFIAYPYQAADAADGKLFAVVTPHGRTFRYTHALVPGEEANNSFAAISPDGQWLVSGEWGSEGRLLVFPMPMLNASVPSGDRALALASVITFDQPADQIQGCDFVTSTRLVCSADDEAKRLLDVRLSAPLAGADVTATVTTLGSLPRVSTCTGTFESEGLDYDVRTRLLRVEVIPPQPCFIHTDEYVYRLRA